MPIPLGARQVPREPNRIRLASGEVVTRARALTLGAQYMGYKSHADYRKRAGSDALYLKSWLKSEQGKLAERREKALAKSRGLPYNRAQLQARLIAARNARGNPEKGKPHGAAYVAFNNRYGFTGTKDYANYS